MAEQKKKYSEQFLEKLGTDEIGMEYDTVKQYGELCFLEGKWYYAYAVEKERIKKLLDALAREHKLIEGYNK